MPTAVMQQSNIRQAGTCPHGLPLGACPICSGMGGAGNMKKADHTAKPGEMSWNECAAIGAMLRAQRNAKMARQQDAINFAQRMAQFDKMMMNASQKLADLTGVISNNFPKIIANPVNFVLNTVIGGIINFAKNVSATIQNAVNTISQKFAEISDKLTAIYGELKAAIAKKIGEPLNTLKKKIKSIFSIFESSNTNNDDKQIDETKKAFRLRTFIHDLYKKLKGDENSLNEQKGTI